MSIRLASKQAIKSTFKQRIGAVLVNKHCVLGVGHNQINRHQQTFKTSHWEGTLHAEIAAILDAIKKCGAKSIEGATLYVARIKKNGEYGLAMPCAACYDLIMKCKIKVVYFTNDGGISKIMV